MLGLPKQGWTFTVIDFTSSFSLKNDLLPRTYASKQVLKVTVSDKTAIFVVSLSRLEWFTKKNI